jgi:hypothetical protein
MYESTAISPPPLRDGMCPEHVLPDPELMEELLLRHPICA